MEIRKMALALPLAFGIACQTTDSNRTAREDTAPAPAGTAATTQGSPGSVGNDAEGGAQTTATPDQTGAQRDTSGTSGSATAQDDGTLTGDRTAGAMGGASDLKGHASDRVLMGKVESVSSGSLSIESDMGDRRTLRVVPETIITVEGRDGAIADLKEGQPIRASFNEQDGSEVAVKIEAGAAGSHMGSDMGTTGTGTDMGHPSGSTSTHDTGTGSTSTGTTGGTSETPSGGK
jgi:hypothetical protein